MVATPHGIGGEMRNQTRSGILATLVLSATVGVVAQSSPTPQNSPEPAPQNSPEPAPQPQATAPAPAAAPAQSTEGKITGAGCLQEAPPSPVGTSGTAAPAPPAATDAPAKSDPASGEARLILANAVPSPAGSSASASNSSAPQTYRLIANAASLKPHVGKKLELSGTVEDQKSSAPSANSSSSMSDGPQLRVEAGKVIAEKCTE
jgi:hypothetical protein